MLKELKDARFERRGRGLRGARWGFRAGRTASAGEWRGRALDALQRAQAAEPVPFLQVGARVYWAFQDRFFWEDDDLGAEDVRALVFERDERARRRLDRAHAALVQGAGPTDALRSSGRRREPIPRPVRQAVWERDGGRCVDCGTDFDLHFDHVIPFALGGASTTDNLQILCAPCNQRKGASVA